MRSCNRIPISRSRIVQLTLRVAFLPEMDCLNEFLQRKTIWKIPLCSTNASRCLLGLSRTVRLRELICMLYIPILNKANLFYAYVTLFEIGGSHIRFRKNQYHIKSIERLEEFNEANYTIYYDQTHWSLDSNNFLLQINQMRVQSDKPTNHIFTTSHVQSLTKYLYNRYALFQLLKLVFSWCHTSKYHTSFQSRNYKKAGRTSQF